MNRFVSAMLAMLMAAFVPAHADDPTEEEAAQLTGQCGEIKNRNISSQFGSGVWLEYIAETVRPVNTFECPWLSVSVEVYVVGVPESAHAATGMFVATSRRQIPVPSPGEWQTNSNHYRNYFWLFSFNAGTMSSKAEVTAAAEQVPSFEEAEEDENFCGGDSDTPCVASGPNEPDSPIIIDVDRNGYHLTSLEDGVFFDLDADGALDFVAWTHPSSEDSFLALDRNGNGRIDDGSELFGNHTPAYAARSSITASNGFEALKFLESPSYGRAERNEVVNARDAAFARLVLWTDRNHNGLSEPDELRPLSESGLLEIRTDYKTARRRDGHGNEFRQRAKGTWQNGEAFVYDVWLKRRP